MPIPDRPHTTKEAYSAERAEVYSGKSILHEAKWTLFNMLTYQPALAFFHPTEKMWTTFARPMIEAGYLNPGEMNGLSILYVSAKAKVEHAEITQRKTPVHP